MLTDAVDDEVGLVALVEGRVDADRIAAFRGGPELLAHAVSVPRDDGVGGREDHGRRAVVLLQPVNGRAELAAEVLHVLDAGSAPAVNRLVVVSDDEGSAALAGELLQPVVLDAVGILELVDEEVAEPVAVVVAELLYVAQEFEAPQQQLRKIHDARLFAAFFVQLVEMDELLACRIVAIGEVLRAASVILAGVDKPCTSRGIQRCSSSFCSRMILRTRRCWSSSSRIWNDCGRRASRQ